MLWREETVTRGKSMMGERKEVVPAIAENHSWLPTVVGRSPPNGPLQYATSAEHDSWTQLRSSKCVTTCHCESGQHRPTVQVFRNNERIVHSLARPLSEACVVHTAWVRTQLWSSLLY